jgi:5'-nucleotidase
MKKIALFDMDDSLFDYKGTLLRDLNSLATPNEPEYTSFYDIRMNSLYIRNRIKLIQSQPGWWKNLPLMSSGKIIWDLTKEMGFHNQILTKGPFNKSWSWSEKVNCCELWFGSEVDIHITSSMTGKSQVYGDVLFDDWSDYMMPWIEAHPKGLGIMPSYDSNANYSHPRVVKYDESEENIDLIRQKLFMVLNG